MPAALETKDGGLENKTLGRPTGTGVEVEMPKDIKGWSQLKEEFRQDGKSPNVALPDLQITKGDHDGSKDGSQRKAPVELEKQKVLHEKTELTNPSLEEIPKGGKGAEGGIPSESQSQVHKVLPNLQIENDQPKKH